MKHAIGHLFNVYTATDDTPGAGRAMDILRALLVAGVPIRRVTLTCPGETGAVL